MADPNEWKTRQIKCMYTNADQLKNKMNELTDRIKLEWPDLIAINEVKYKNTKDRKLKEGEFTIDMEIGNKYEVFSNNIEEDEGRGQIMYVDKMLKAEPITLTTKVTEILAIRITEGTNHAIIIALVYRSPSSSHRNNARVRKAIDELVEINSSELIIMGDFNYKEINWEQDTASGEEQMMFVECIQQNFLTQHVKEITRFRGKDEPSRVDLIFSKEEESIDEISYQCPLGKSDHKVLVFQVLATITRSIEVEKKVMYKKANMQEIIEEAKSLDWEDTLNTSENSMIEIVENFNKEINELMDRHIPTANVNNRQGMRPPLDTEMKRLIKEKEKAARAANESKKTGSRYEFEEARKVYNRARNKVSSYSRKLRKEFEQGIASGAKDGNKEIFAYINSKSKVKKRIGKICKDPENEKSTKTDNDEEKAKIFSKFFISVQTTEPDGVLPEFPTREIKVPMKDIVKEITEERVEKLLKELKESTSAGPDLSPRILKPLAEIICKPPYNNL